MCVYVCTLTVVFTTCQYDIIAKYSSSKLYNTDYTLSSMAFLYEWAYQWLWHEQPHILRKCQ